MTGSARLLKECPPTIRISRWVSAVDGGLQQTEDEKYEADYELRVSHGCIGVVSKNGLQGSLAISKAIATLSPGFASASAELVGLGRDFQIVVSELSIVHFCS